MNRSDVSLYEPPTTQAIASWVLASDDPREAAERARAWCYLSRDALQSWVGGGLVRSAGTIAADLWLFRAYTLHGMILALDGAATCGRTGPVLVRCGLRSCNVCRGA